MTLSAEKKTYAHVSCISHKSLYPLVLISAYRKNKKKENSFLHLQIISQVSLKKKEPNNNVQNSSTLGKSQL